MNHNGIPLKMGIKDLHSMPIEHDIQYILCLDGFFLYKKNKVFESITNENTKETIINLLSPKLSIELIDSVLLFFKEIYKEYKGEAMGYLVLDKDNKWEFKVPKQTVTGASVDYESPDGYTPFGTIHSHGNMSAFHSGTDIDDEYDFDGIHITIGNVNTLNPTYAFSVVSNGERKKLTMEEVVSLPKATFPEEWKKQVSKKTYQKKSITYTKNAQKSWIKDENRIADSGPLGGILVSRLRLGETYSYYDQKANIFREVVLLSIPVYKKQSWHYKAIDIATKEELNFKHKDQESDFL